MKFKIKKKNESSTVGGIKGFSGPFGAKVVKRSGKQKKNFSKPFGEAELFENLIVEAALDEEDIGEVVKKIGSRWVIYDDETEASRGSFNKRSIAWEKQRQIRKNQQAKQKAKGAEKKRQKMAATTQTERKPKNTLSKKQEVLNRVKQIIRENFFQYIFEQPEPDQKTQMWNKFIENLPNETLMSDDKLKGVLINLAKGEQKVLEKSFLEIKSILDKTREFEVQRKNMKRDEETGKIKLFFIVKPEESQKQLLFAVAIENGRPLIYTPEQTRQEIVSLGNPEVKLLQGELIHIQETVLNKIEDMVVMAGKRDDYLRKMENIIDNFITKMTPLQISMIKFLIKTKYRGIK